MRTKKLLNNARRLVTCVRMVLRKVIIDSHYMYLLSSYLTSLHQLIFVCTSLGPFELIDHNGDGNITRDEWQEKIELAMEKVMYVTNATFNESLYDDIWETLDCNNATALDIEVKS